MAKVALAVAQPEMVSSSALQKLEKRLSRAQDDTANAEYLLEAEQNKGLNALMTLGQDVATHLGGFAAGKICAIEGIPGTKLCITAGILADAFRPLTEANGYGRLATSMPHGLGVGGTAIASYDGALERQASSARMRATEYDARQAQAA